MIHPREISRSRLSDSTDQGFALVIVLAILAMLLILVLVFSSVLHVESRVSATARDNLLARQNALLGLQVAMGQLQEYAGRDQAVTFPATTFYPTKALNVPGGASVPTPGRGELFDSPVFGYRTFAQTSASKTSLTATEREQWETSLRNWWNAGRNPRWIGIMDASLRVDRAGNPQAAPAPLAPQPYETLGAATKFGEPKRDQLPIWLVSGNEHFSIDQNSGEVRDTTGAVVATNAYPSDYQTPITPLPDPASSSKIVWLVGEGSATPATDSFDGLDGRVKAKKIDVTTADNTVSGHYAYWVGDESTKANFAVRDPFETSTPGSTEYRNRLQVPQRIGWENLPGFDVATFSPNDERLLNVSASREIALLEASATEAVQTAAKENFHSLTAFSRSVPTDTILGGLKKDLTPFFEGGGGGINTTSSLADAARYVSNDSRFGTGTGFPASVQNIGTWADLKSWFDSTSTGSGTVAVAPGRAPVVTNYQMFFGFTHENGKIQHHFVPMVVLWNPFDAPLASTSYRLRWRHNYVAHRVAFATEGVTDPTPAKTDDGEMIGTTNWYVHQLRPLGWYRRGVSGVKVFGMALDETSGALRDPWSGGAPSDSRFSPLDLSNSSSAIPGPGDTLSTTGKEPTWVTYTFTAAFEPGQALVFTVDPSAPPMKLADPSLLQTGAVTIPLVNDYDPSLPSSYCFDIAEFVDPVGATTIPDGTKTTRFFAEMRLIDTPKFMSMRLETGAGQQLWNADFLGDPGNWGPYFNLQYTPSAISSANPSTWRRLYPLSEWLSVDKSTTNGRQDAIIPMYRGRLSPFDIEHTRIYHQSKLSFEQVSKFSRAFALFNLAAPSLDLNKNLEGSRNSDSQTRNTDGFGSLQLFLSEAPTSGNVSGFMDWDNNQTELNGGDLEGFPLLEWRKLDNLYLNIQGVSRLPVRQVRRADASLLSLGQLQQANVSRFSWQPSFAIGNSEASPYVDRARIAGLESYSVGSANTSGFAKLADWYRPAGTIPNDALNRMVDVSYLLNENLWDRYFLSAIPQSGAIQEPLRNARHRIDRPENPTDSELRDSETAAAFINNVGALNVNSTSKEAWKALLTAFRGLSLTSGAGSNPSDTVPIGRVLDPLTGAINYTFDGFNAVQIGAANGPQGGRDYSQLFTGFRYMTDDMIDALADRIVDEVRLRGPFLSLSDFVNRRLVAPDGAYTSGSVWQRARTANQSSAISTGFAHSYGVEASDYSGAYTDPVESNYNPVVGLSGINGALQRAINLSGINGGINGRTPFNAEERAFRLTNSNGKVDPTAVGGNAAPFMMSANVAGYLDTEHLAGAATGEAGSLLSHTPGFVTQGDLLSMIGPALTARGDTFLVRTYGDSVDRNGRLLARAWLEAVVQRVAEPVTPAEPTGPEQWRYTDRFGRKFEVIKLRWLKPEEV